MSGKLDVSVVICAYTEDRWDDLVAAVKSVQDQSEPPREIVIVIDHNMTLLERVRARWPGVVVIENREPRGLGGARNSSIAASSGAVIAFLDDDAIAAPDWLEELLASYEPAEVVGVGGAIEPIWQGGRPAWFPEEFDWVVGCTYRGMPQMKAAVRNLIGANMSFRCEVFEHVGRFRLGYGCDETDFCIRVGQHWPRNALLYQPCARVYHQVPASRARWHYFRSRCFFEGGSKAVVSWLSGSRDGLASERAYTLRTLPRGIGRGLSDAVLRGDKAGLARAGAIIAGLVITAFGYLRGSVSVVAAARARGWTDQPERHAV